MKKKKTKKSKKKCKHIYHILADEFLYFYSFQDWLNPGQFIDNKSKFSEEFPDDEVYSPQYCPECGERLND